MTTPTDINNFLLSLLVAIGAQAGVGDVTALPRSLWLDEAKEGTLQDGTQGCAATYTVMRSYGGNSQESYANSRIPSVSVQFATTGKDKKAARAQAWLLYEALLDDLQRPRMHWAVPGKLLVADALVADAGGDWVVDEFDFVSGLPGLTGRDEADRWTLSFNVDVDFHREPAAP